MLEYESGYCPTLMKLKGLGIYISLRVTPPIANWFWVGTSFELIYMTRLFMAQFIKKFNMVGLLDLDLSPFPFD